MNHKQQGDCMDINKMILCGIGVIAILSFNSDIAPSLNSEVRIIDGDTIELKTKEKHRFACIDAIEKKQPLGEEASKYLANLMNNEKPLSYHYYDTDSFGRKITEIYKGSENINLSMVKAGYAKVNYNYLNCIDNEQYLKAERIAKKEKKGMWGLE